MIVLVMSMTGQLVLRLTIGFLLELEKGVLLSALRRCRYLKYAPMVNALTLDCIDS